MANHEVARVDLMGQREAIERAGQQARRARREHDESRARHWTEWARKACDLEQDRAEAWRWFQDAYRNG